MMKKTLVLLGVILWVGALSPEIFIKTGLGCIYDENGDSLTADEADEFMEEYFFGNNASGSGHNLKYKIALSELLKK